MEKRIIKIKSGSNEVEMEVTQEQYAAYMRPWWASQQRAKRNRDAMEEKGFIQESYDDWKDKLIDDTAASDSVEELVEKKMMLELLNEALDSLMPDEKEMAVTVLTEEMSLSEYARRCDSSRTTLSDKKRKVLRKLRCFFADRGYNVNRD